jgi:hypothetical protein
VVVAAEVLQQLGLQAFQQQQQQQQQGVLL